MKFTINTKDILKILQTVGSLIKSPNQMPVLDNVLINLTDGKLQVVADNLEVRSTAEMPVEFTGSYSTCIPYQLLIATLKGFPNTPVEFIFGEKVLTIQALTGDVVSGKYDIPMVAADEFPKNKFDISGDKTIINSLDLVECLKKSIHYIDEKSQNGMSNMLLWITPEGTKVVGGNTRLIYECSLPDVKGAERKLMLSKSVSLYLTQSIIEDGDIEISHNDNHIFLSMEGREISAVLGNLAYPKYEILFDKLTTDKTFHVESDSLMPALKRLCNITDKNSFGIDFYFDADTLEMTFNHIAQKCNAKEVLKVDYDGEPILIGLNATQLSAVFSSLEGTIKMQMLDMKSVCLITGDNVRVLNAPILPAVAENSSPRQ